MTPALVCGKHLLDLDHGLLRDITFSQHSAGVGRLSDGRSKQCPLSSVRPASAPGSTRTGRIYTVFTGEWEIGRIYETRGGPDNLRWFWSMTVNGPMTRSDRVATLEEAKAQFQKSWDAWKAWAKRKRWSSVR